MQKQGVKPKELENLVELPRSFKQCWHFFLDLNSTRNQGFGVSPITYVEIYAYFNLMQLDYEPWEIEAIKAFDRIAMDVAAKQQERENKLKKKPT